MSTSNEYKAKGHQSFTLCSWITVLFSCWCKELCWNVFLFFYFCCCLKLSNYFQSIFAQIWKSTIVCDLQTSHRNIVLMNIFNIQKSRNICSWPCWDLFDLDTSRKLSSDLSAKHNITFFGKAICSFCLYHQCFNLFLKQHHVNFSSSFRKSRNYLIYVIELLYFLSGKCYFETYGTINFLTATFWRWLHLTNPATWHQLLWAHQELFLGWPNFVYENAFARHDKQFNKHWFRKFTTTINNNPEHHRAVFKGVSSACRDYLPAGATLLLTACLQIKVKH